MYSRIQWSIGIRDMMLTRLINIAAVNAFVRRVWGLLLMLVSVVLHVKVHAPGFNTTNAVLFVPDVQTTPEKADSPQSHSEGEIEVHLFVHRSNHLIVLALIDSHINIPAEVINNMYAPGFNKKTMDCSLESIAKENAFNPYIYCHSSSPDITVACTRSSAHAFQFL
jgi:hypothetical protein